MPATKEVLLPVRRAARWRPRPYSLIVPIVSLVVWEVVAQLHIFPPLFFPSVGKIAIALVDTVTGYPGTSDLYSGQWSVHALASTQRVVIGFVIGGFAGVLFGTVVGMFPLFDKTLDPSIQLLRPIPIVAWIPLGVVWFGIENKPAIFLIALGTFFPTYLNTRHGIEYVDPLLLRAANMLGYLSSWDLFRRVIFFSALPSIFTGLRIGLGMAWMCVVAAEMLAVKSGFGYMLWDSYNFLRADLIIVGMISIGVLGFLADRVMLMIRRFVMVWER